MIFTMKSLLPAPRKRMKLQCSPFTAVLGGLSRTPIVWSSFAIIAIARTDMGCAYSRGIPVKNVGNYSAVTCFGFQATGPPLLFRTRNVFGTVPGHDSGIRSLNLESHGVRLHLPFTPLLQLKQCPTKPSPWDRAVRSQQVC